MASELLPVGTLVEFDSDGPGSCVNTGVVLEYEPGDEGLVRPAYVVACYYQISVDEAIVSMDNDDEELKPQPQTRLLSEKTGLDYHTVNELLHKGWRYIEELGEISRWEHPMWAIEDKKIH